MLPRQCQSVDPLNVDLRVSPVIVVRRWVSFRLSNCDVPLRELLGRVGHVPHVLYPSERDRVRVVAPRPSARRVGQVRFRTVPRLSNERQGQEGHVDWYVGTCLFSPSCQQGRFMVTRRATEKVKWRLQFDTILYRSRAFSLVHGRHLRPAIYSQLYDRGLRPRKEMEDAVVFIAKGRRSKGRCERSSVWHPCSR